MEKKSKENLPSCCHPKNGGSIKQGIFYGLIPHTGCIAFIVGSVLGVTVLMQFFKPLLMNRYFFHYLILLSLLFATFSSGLYLKKLNLLSMHGVRRKKKYLFGMYGSTVGINLVLFFLIFPFFANLSSAGPDDLSGLSTLKISVDIPCPGHAPLISNELGTLEGVKGSEFSFPNDFDVFYDPNQLSKEEILTLDVFGEYPAEVLSETSPDQQQIVASLKKVEPLGQASGDSGSCNGACGSPSCTGSCGGSCGG